MPSDNDPTNRCAIALATAVGQQAGALANLCDTAAGLIGGADNLHHVELVALLRRTAEAMDHWLSEPAQAGN